VHRLKLNTYKSEAVGRAHVSKLARLSHDDKVLVLPDVALFRHHLTVDDNAKQCDNLLLPHAPNTSTSSVP